MLLLNLSPAPLLLVSCLCLFFKFISLRFIFHSCPALLAAGCWQLCCPQVVPGVPQVHCHGRPSSDLPPSASSRFPENTMLRQLIWTNSSCSVFPLWLKGELKCLWTANLLKIDFGAIKFLSNHFWFRKYSAILNTSNIYFCLICFTFSFRWGKLFVFHLWVLSKAHSSVAEENAYLATLFLCTVFCSLCYV